MTSRLAIVLSVVAFVGAGCGHARPPEPASGVTDTPRDLLDPMPPDLWIVGGVNVGRLASSPLFGPTMRERMEGGEGGEIIRKSRELCHLDPLTDISQVVMGMGASGEDSIVLVVRGNFTSAQIEKCLVVMGEAEGKKVSATTKDGITTVVGDNAEGPTYLGWLDAHTFVGMPVTTDRHDPAALVEALARSHPDVPRLDALMGQVDQTHGFWLVADLTASDDVRNGMAGTLGAAPVGGWVDLDHQDGLHGVLAARFASPAEAVAVTEKLDQAVQQLAPQGPMLGVADLTRAVHVESRALDSVITITLSDEELTNLVRSVGSMLGP